MSSAVYDEFQEKLMEGAFNDIETVRLINDIFSGQKKNSMLLVMCRLWLNRNPSNIKRLEIVFPVTGHSFMPSDMNVEWFNRKNLKQEGYHCGLERLP